MAAHSQAINTRKQALSCGGSREQNNKLQIIVGRAACDVRLSTARSVLELQAAHKATATRMFNCDQQLETSRGAWQQTQRVQIEIELLVHFHDGCLIATAVTVVRSTENGDHTLFMRPVVALQQRQLTAYMQGRHIKTQQRQLKACTQEGKLEEEFGEYSLDEAHLQEHKREYRRVPTFSPYGSVCCACAQRTGLPRACHSG